MPEEPTIATADPETPVAPKGALLVVFLTVFVDLLGFGIVLPLLPRYAERTGATDATVGMLVASFSLMQFVFAPLWGRLSDRVGRRPVLVVGLLGSVVSYLLFAWAAVEASLALLFVSRLGAGVAGATIPTAQAYIADVTTKKNRTKGLALVGAAFGIGFTAGPLLGVAALSLEGDRVERVATATIDLPDVQGSVRATYPPEDLIATVRESAVEVGTVEGVEPLRRLPTDVPVTALGFLPGGRLLSLGGADGTVRVVSWRTGRPRLTLEASDRPLVLVEYDAADRQMLTVDDAGTQSRWNLGRLSRWPGVLAAAISGVALLLALFLLPESLRSRRDAAATINAAEADAGAASTPTAEQTDAAHGHGRRRWTGVSDWRRVRAIPGIGGLILIGFLVIGAFSMLETTFAVLTDAAFGLTDRQNGYAFAYIGLLIVLAQGVLVRRLSGKVRDESILRWGTAVHIAGFVGLLFAGYAGSVTLLALTLPLVVAGFAMMSTSVQSLISVRAPEDEQGTVLGVNQSASSLARIVGPYVGYLLFGVAILLPYMVAVGIMVFAFAVILRVARPQLRQVS